MALGLVGGDTEDDVEEGDVEACEQISLGFPGPLGSSSTGKLANPGLPSLEQTSKCTDGAMHKTLSQLPGRSQEEWVPWTLGRSRGIG